MPQQLLKKAMTFKVKAVDRENYIIRGVFSTDEVDRHGEIVEQSGWKLEEYMSNPVVLFAHDHYRPAIGKMVELSKDSGVLEGAIQFAVKENPEAKVIFDLYAERYMRAFSAGFMNDRYEVDEENDVIILKENTLYEVSCVNVPANALALAKSKGMDVSLLMEKKVEEPKEEPADVAVKTLLATDENTKRKAIKALTEALEVFRADTQDRGKKGRTPRHKTGGSQRVSVKVFNRTIRVMLKAKKIHSRGN